jgi:hypothetical protein
MTNPMMVIMQATTANSILTVLQKKNTPDSILSINPSHPGSPTVTKVQQLV